MYTFDTFVLTTSRSQAFLGMHAKHAALLSSTLATTNKTYNKTFNYIHGSKRDCFLTEADSIFNPVGISTKPW